MYYPVTWNALHSQIHNLSEKIKNSHVSIDCIATIARGGLALSNMLADFLQVPVTSFTVTTYKNMEKQSDPEVRFSISPEVRDKKVLLFDDIADTGETLRFGVDYLRQNGAIEIHTSALFLKPQSVIVPDFYEKKVNEWVIFPFEIDETLSVYKQLQSENPEKAKELWTNILKLGLPDDLLTL
jgi:hypoxanthine phosphoribosyltransferase